MYDLNLILKIRLPLGGGVVNVTPLGSVFGGGVEVRLEGSETGLSAGLSGSGAILSERRE